MKRVLICGFTENYGGMESYIMGIYRNIDRCKLQFDFINVFSCKIAYEDEIKSLGGEIFYVPQKRNNPYEHYKKLKELFNNNSFCAVYYQCNRKLVSFDVFKYAKKSGVPCRIIHSHNSTQIIHSKLDGFRQKLAEKKLDIYVNTFFACSEEAGKWMFGNRKFSVIKNSVNTDMFRFDPVIRNEIRTKYDVDNKLIVGTVGRLEEQKNPEYIVDIANELYKQNNNVLFWHVGEGTYKQKMQDKISEYNLSGIYSFFDRNTPVYEMMNAMDVFILPSKHEGFPIVLVEAQSTGLTCVLADNITTSCDLTGMMNYMSIDVEPKLWAKKILEVSQYERKDMTRQINNKGYDIKSVALEIQEYFLQSKGE